MMSLHFDRLAGSDCVGLESKCCVEDTPNLGNRLRDTRGGGDFALSKMAKRICDNILQASIHRIPDFGRSGASGYLHTESWF